MNTCPSLTSNNLYTNTDEQLHSQPQVPESSISVPASPSSPTPARPAVDTVNNPTTSRPTIPDADELVVLRNQSSSRRDFAKNVVIATFTEEERLTSNVNGKAGKKQLSPNRMEAVREAVFRVYPLDAREKEKDVWPDCIRAIDEAGRKLNQK